MHKHTSMAILTRRSVGSMPLWDTYELLPIQSILMFVLLFSPCHAPAGFSSPKFTESCVSVSVSLKHLFWVPYKVSQRIRQFTSLNTRLSWRWLLQETVEWLFASTRDTILHPASQEMSRLSRRLGTQIWYFLEFAISWYFSVLLQCYAVYLQHCPIYPRI